MINPYNKIDKDKECLNKCNSLIFTFVKNLGKYSHNEALPIDVDNTYIQKYIFKSFWLFTNVNIDITLINFIYILHHHCT